MENDKEWGDTKANISQIQISQILDQTKEV